jgi:hypothetical protein
LQVAKQSDGTTKLYLWISSFSSPYLLKRPPGPPSKPAPPLTVGGGCDDFCQSLKKAFEARANAFEDIRGVKADGASDTTVKLGGAKECIVNGAESHSDRPGLQFVCYWREGSDSAAEIRFRDLISRLQVLIPSNWSIHQDNKRNDLTGEDLTVWYGVEPSGEHDVQVYVSGEYVGLHISASN